MNTKGIPVYCHVFVLAAISYFVIFLKIGSFHIRWWDESMFAVNSYEMLHNGKYLSAYYDGVADLFNSKPPLTSWLQIVFIKFLGYTELAIRLPSALAACATVLILFIYIAKSLNIRLAWISALILLSSSGFIHFHTGRTGDSDALLTFFLLMTNICFINYMRHTRKRDILIFFVFLSLSFATKMFAALLFTPAYLVILLLDNKLKEFILNRAFLAGILFLLLSGFGLLYFREMDNPGYLNGVILLDAGRLFHVVGRHTEPFSFYLEHLVSWQFSVWAVLFVIGALFFQFSHDKNKKKYCSVS